MQDSTLIRMANQIATFFASSGHEAAVHGIAGHIRSFWEPRMRRALYAYVDAGGEGLAPVVLEGVEALRQADKAALEH